MALFLEILRNSILAATPILLAAIGGLYTYHANVFNIAMEGMMLLGAFLGVLGSFFAGSWVVGMVAGIGGGMVIAALFALFVVLLKTDEFITGIAINLLCLGGTTYALRQIFDVKGAFISPRIVGLPRWNIMLIRDIPLLQDLFRNLPFLVWIAILTVIVAQYHIYGTRFGLRLRAAGESTQAVNSVGVRANRLKVSTIIISGALCGLSGVFLSLGIVTLFTENISNGRGWISLAIIILTKGSPIGALVMSLLFGLFDGIGLTLQENLIPSQFTQMMPYLITLFAIFIYSRSRSNRRAKW